jgi:hypothetical protein
MSERKRSSVKVSKKSMFSSCKRGRNRHTIISENMMEYLEDISKVVGRDVNRILIGALTEYAYRRGLISGTPPWHKKWKIGPKERLK